MDQQRDSGRQRKAEAGRIEPTLPLDMPRAENPEPRPIAGRRARPATKRAAAVDDLFGAEPPAGPNAEQTPEAGADGEPAPATACPEPSPAVDPEPPPAPSSPDAVLLRPDEVLLQRVDARSFRPNERADSWLYWLTDRDRAQDALRDGVPVELDDAPLLLDRPQVLPRLAVLAEDPDFAPAAVAVLRLKRIAVEPFLRPGPGSACYVLSGPRNVSA